MKSYRWLWYSLDIPYSICSSNLFVPVEIIYRRSRSMHPQQCKQFWLKFNFLGNMDKFSAMILQVIFITPWILSICSSTGFDAKRIWDHSENNIFYCYVWRLDFHSVLSLFSFIWHEACAQYYSLSSLYRWKKFIQHSI